VSESDLAPERDTLSVEADLTVTVDDREYRLFAEDGVITVVAPSVSAAIALLRSLPDGELDQLGPLFQRAGQTVVVRVGEETVATFDSTPQWAPDADGVGLRSVSVEPRALLAAAGDDVRAHPVATVGVALALVLVVRWLWRRRRS